MPTMCGAHCPRYSVPVLAHHRHVVVRLDVMRVPVAYGDRQTAQDSQLCNNREEPVD